MAEYFPEDDPYEVYTLRRPAERASNLVPQLPKLPEYTETRLRYRRIARSGSLQDLSFLPGRFNFPARVSGLDPLSEDDSMVLRVDDGRVVRAPSAWGGVKDFVLLVETPGMTAPPEKFDMVEKRDLSVCFVRENWLKRLLRFVRLLRTTPTPSRRSSP